MKSIAVIANPFAGTARGRLSGADAADRLRGLGHEVALCPTDAAGHATELAREQARRRDLVVAVGGDGTIHETACGLVGTGCTLGVLPSGSGNDFATGIGCGSVEAGMNAIESGVRREIDVCALDGEPFINSLGLLASGYISNQAARLWRWLGAGRYAVASARAALFYHGQQIEWEVQASPGDPEPPVPGRWLLAEFCNGPLTGGGFRLVEGADYCDGLMDACLVTPIGPLTGLRILPGAIAGRPIRHPAFRTYRTARVDFETTEAVPYHLDGEADYLPAGRHRVEVLPQKLKVMMGS